MPSQSHSGWQGTPWHRCDRCGFDYPVSLLVRQAGLIVCRVKCYDKSGSTGTAAGVVNDEREAIIKQVLSNGADEAGLADILKNNFTDLENQE